MKKKITKERKEAISILVAASNSSTTEIEDVKTIRKLEKWRSSQNYPIDNNRMIRKCND